MTASCWPVGTGAAYAAQIRQHEGQRGDRCAHHTRRLAGGFLVVPAVVAPRGDDALVGALRPTVWASSAAWRLPDRADIPPTAYWVEMLTIVDLSDVATGLIKATPSGLSSACRAACAGCRPERSAEGVGRAATSAVVTAILLMIRCGCALRRWCSTFSGGEIMNHQPTTPESQSCSGGHRPPLQIAPLYCGQRACSRGLSGREQARCPTKSRIRGSSLQ